MKKTTKKNTAKKSSHQPTYRKATKTMPHMINDSYVLHVTFSKKHEGTQVIKAIEKFMKDYDLETRGPAGRVIIKRFLTENGYLK